MRKLKLFALVCSVIIVAFGAIAFAACTNQVSVPATMSTTNDNAGFISMESAKEIVLKHANLSESEISQYKCKLDADDFIPNYEIEFRSGIYEYDYEVNAKTGDIIKCEKEID